MFTENDNKISYSYIIARFHIFSFLRILFIRSMENLSLADNVYNKLKTNLLWLVEDNNCRSKCWREPDFVESRSQFKSRYGGILSSVGTITQARWPSEMSSVSWWVFKQTARKSQFPEKTIRFCWHTKL